MSEDNKRLEDFLDQAAKRKVEREEEEQRRVEGPRRFKDTFLAVAASKIRPVLDTACEPWLKRGLPAGVDVDDVSSSPSVTLMVEPHPQLRGELVYTGQIDDRKILAYRHFGPGAGEPIGQFGLNDITRDLVQKHVDDFIAEVVRLGGR